MRLSRDYFQGKVLACRDAKGDRETGVCSKPVRERFGMVALRPLYAFAKLQGNTFCEMERLCLHWWARTIRNASPRIIRGVEGPAIRIYSDATGLGVQATLTYWDRIGDGAPIFDNARDISLITLKHLIEYCRTLRTNCPGAKA